MMKSLALFSLLFVSINFCQTFSQRIDEERQIGSFTKLKVQQGIRVYLAQAEEESLHIEVKGYSPDDVIAESINGVLHLSMNAPLWRSGSVTARVGYVNLEEIHISSGSNLFAENKINADKLTVKASGGCEVNIDVNTNYLDCAISGGSDLEARGDADEIKVIASGGCDVEAMDLKAKRCVLKISGGSDANVYASEVAEVIASGGSGVNIYGNPKVRNLDSDISSDIAIR